MGSLSRQPGSLISGSEEAGLRVELQRLQSLVREEFAEVRQRLAALDGVQEQLAKVNQTLALLAAAASPPAPAAAADDDGQQHND